MVKINIERKIKMNVLITGGAGYIGSVVVEELIESGHEAVVYDNLSKGFRQAVHSAAKFVHADLNDVQTLRETLAQNNIEAVIHLAADSLVGESVQNPSKYYRNNFLTGLELLDALLEVDVKRIVFSSTAAVYGEPEEQPITENTPTNPINPYGETKLAFENALAWYDKAYALRFASLRYFNAAGATERCGECHDPETHLIPLILQAASGKRPFVEIFGDDYPTRDGTCVRDYIHVTDLARAHILALDVIDERSKIYNLGCGEDGYTVSEVIDVARKVTGKDFPIRIGQRRAGDPAVLVASSDKIKSELGWKPEKQDLETIIESVWKWMLKHPDGYIET
jgi:UDP-glucose 4-epimerase